MTTLGLYLQKRSANKAEVARKAGITPQRMNEITLNEKSHLRARELYLIGLAIGVNPGELLNEIFKGETLK